MKLYFFLVTILLFQSCKKGSIGDQSSSGSQVKELAPSSSDSRFSPVDYAKLCSGYETVSSDIEADVTEQIAETCECISQRYANAKQEFCGSSGKIKAWQRSLYDFANRSRPSEVSASCFKNKLSQRFIIFASFMYEDCKVLSYEQFASRYETKDLRQMSMNSNCWIIDSMTNDGCFLTTPCPLSPGSSGSGLSLANNIGRNVFAGEKIKICNKGIQSIYPIKDPHLMNHAYQKPIPSYAFFPQFEFSRAPNETRMYGIPNCHGTAQALSGKWLENSPISKISFYSREKEDECKPVLEKQLSGKGIQFKVVNSRYEAQSNSWLLNNPVTKDDLPFTLGGLHVQMKHSDCSRSDCGSMSVLINSCTLGASQMALYLDGMCVECWKFELEKNGYTDFKSRNWRDWYPGCILSDNDHSATLLLNSAGMCSLFQSTTINGSPQLNLFPCAELAERFKIVYCPKEPMKFTYTP